MWEYEAITIDYNAQALGDGLKGHPRIAEILTSYANRGWEVVTTLSLSDASGPMFILRRAVDMASGMSESSGRGTRTTRNS